MAISKIVLNGTTQMDITDTTAQSEDVAQGVYFYGADGVKKEGSMAEGGTSTTSDKVVHFIDYDGTALYDYSKDEWTNITSLPAVPSHQGLVSQGWNWTKTQIDSYLADCPNGDVFVGVTYTTDTGHTRIYIHLDERYKSPMLGINVNGTVDVNWGDGTAHATLTGTSLDAISWTSNHSYSRGGDYVIELTISGEATIASGVLSLVATLAYSANSSDSALNKRYATFIKKIEIGSNVTGISNSSFYDCRKLETITIPNTVTSIGNSVFSKCVSLKSVVFPNEITGFNKYMLDTCISLKSVALPNGITNIGDYCFNKCTSLESVTIPSGVTTIGTYAFQECASLKTVTIPNTVTSISTYAFYKCYLLESLAIPSGITTIKSNLCQECTSLRKVTIPDTVTSLASYSFTHCRSLESITIPSGVTTIGSYTFSNWISIKAIHMQPTTPPTLSSKLSVSGDNLSYDVVIYVPSESLNTYKTDSMWSLVADYMVGE